ncbi:MAG: zinc ribbon domain-containing protein [Verrucomicrobia bacterium]|nr:MAG: zinc ribbon domain-containing protein [Verrucomicrobiota bacterium]
MPLRAYQPLSKPCRLCGDGFEIMQAATEPALSECPRCGAPVRPCPAAGVSIPRITRKPSISEAKQAGFTVLKRTSGGEYEKQ